MRVWPPMNIRAAEYRAQGRLSTLACPYRVARRSYLPIEGLPAPATVKAKSLESALKVEPVAVTKPATVEQVQAEPKHTKTQAQRGGLVRGSVKADAGRIGGESTSPAKTAAAKVNGARGGRPRKAVAS